MKSITQINPMLRAIGVIGVVAALVTSVTFAALQSQATLTQNTISTDTADLNVSSGGAFGETATGFAIEDLVPGVGVERPFYLQNTSGFDMTISASATAPVSEDGITDYAQVVVEFTNLDPAVAEEDKTVVTNLAALIAGEVDLSGVLPAGATGSGDETPNPGDYQIKFDINQDGLEDVEQAQIGAFDITFTGTQVEESTPPVVGPTED